MRTAVKNNVNSTNAQKGAVRIGRGTFLCHFSRASCG
jgi:hypothetical protein